MVDGCNVCKSNWFVGIVISSVVAAAWRNSGECWKAISSRIVYARLKVVITEAEEVNGTFVCL